MCAQKHTSKEIPGRHTGLPLRQMTIRQKNKQMQGRTDVCAQTHTSKEIPGRHTGLPLQKKGNKTKEQKDKQNVGAQRCVRPKKK